MNHAHLIIPNQFQAKEKLLHLKLDMKLKDKHGVEFGTITQKVIQVDHAFQFRDAHDHLVAVCHKKTLHPDTRFEVLDRDHHEIGYIDHKVIKSHMSVNDKFEIKDKTNGFLGSSDELDLFKNHVVINDKHNQMLGEMIKEDHLLRDVWKCRIGTHEIDRRILVFIPAFATVMREEKKKKEKQQKHSS